MIPWILLMPSVETGRLKGLMGELGGLAVNYFAMLVRRELVLSAHGMLVLGADTADISWLREVTWHLAWIGL